MIPSRRAWIFRGWSSRTRRCGGRWTTRDTGRYNSGHMNAGTKFAIGAVLIVGSVGYLMASGVKQTGQYFLTPTELTQKIAVDPSFYDVGMKVGARVVPGTVSKDVATQMLRFQVTDGSARLLVAVVSLEWALFQHDFNVEYVAAYTSRNLPIFYTWSALYAGQKGSLLFWATVLSVFGSLALVLTPRHHRALLPHVAGVVSLVAAFFISVMLFGQANPFQRLPYTPLDGNGLNPQLQNPGMVFHPPMLYLGYISITIPFAFAIAALLSKRLDTDWLVAIRKWTLLSWLFLSIGICLGMWWAYVELGWGGYWAWDPVENAPLLPWLTMTAFLHSVMIQEKRGMLKKWNLALIIGSWLLSIFGTFITRSGVIASVHSFTQSNVGWFFLAFLILAGVLSFTLLYTRWPELEAEVQLESMLSREAAFLFNNLLLVGIAFSVLWGTLFPILS